MRKIAKNWRDGVKGKEREPASFSVYLIFSFYTYTILNCFFSEKA